MALVASGGFGQHKCPDNSLGRSMANDSPLELATIARSAARLGGEVLRSWRGRFQTHCKGGSDFVTDADFASQQAVLEEIRRHRPSDLFVGEEGDSAKLRPGRDELAWIVDPLDGTTNYVHGFPCYGVSIGVARGSHLLAGAVYDPERDELFWASAGGGAHLESPQGAGPIGVSAVKQLDQALVAMSLPANVTATSPDLLDFVRLAVRCQGVRRLGSAALNLAYVACGKLDANWAREINPWDVAAGVLLVQEAGGAVSNAHGGPFDLWRADYVVGSTAGLHCELVAAING